MSLLIRISVGRIGNPPGRNGIPTYISFQFGQKTPADAHKPGVQLFLPRPKRLYHISREFNLRDPLDLLPHHLDDEPSRARAGVEVQEDDLLPGAQRQLARDDGHD